MIGVRAPVLVGLVLVAASAAAAQSPGMNLPPSVTAGTAFSIPTSGSGQAILILAGPGQVLRESVSLGQPVSFAPGVLYSAGRYVAVLAQGSATDSGVFDVTPVPQPQKLSFLARPSRLPVALPNGVSGTAFVFDAYHNIITTPVPVSFQLSDSTGKAQERTVTSRDGVAWTRMNSASKEGTAKFVARAGDVASTRVIDEVPGDPCSLTLIAHPDGSKVALQTAPVRDCSGNPVPDGTIVTFTEARDGLQSTVDVPIKQDVARVDMPSWDGATISVASGIVAGNEIRWEGR